VNAQQARRILDRLVGYQLSPLLWRKVQKGLSAGRVQSVALRLVVDREEEIEAFVPREYWRIEARLAKKGQRDLETNSFIAALHSEKGRRGRLDIPDETTARRIVGALQDAAYHVRSIEKRVVRQSPAPPFTTSTLQQEAWRKLRFPARKTMFLAQQLYEGIALGEEGSVGLITYMRTDSTHVAASALNEARDHIREAYGEAFLPARARIFTRRARGAQEAHEAIRPTSIRRTSQEVKRHLSADQQKLYQLIWARMLASQMTSAVSENTTVNIEAQRSKARKAYLFRAAGSVLKFPGFRTLYLEGRDERDEEADTRQALPPLAEGEALDCLGLVPEQRFTQPPPRYTEATLIRALEEKGIGRPSTYAPILSTLSEREYVSKKQGRLLPTALGREVSHLLVQFFPTIMDPEFTARMEEDLDRIAQGAIQWVPVLSQFYEPFKNALEEAADKMPRVRVEEPTGEDCPECGKPLMIRRGRYGSFVGCSGFPRCRYTRPLVKSTDVKCPRCAGELVERRGRKKRRTFYGCSNYPECDFTVSRRPLPQRCPECSGLLVASGRTRAQCTNCAYKGPVPEEETREAVAEATP